ncbi:MAG TPA: glutaminyl-peptide cyclotransferase, partial [Thermoanaerobaculia bacterium]
MARKRTTYSQPQRVEASRSIPRWAMILVLMTFIVLAALWYFRSSPHPEPEAPSEAAAAPPAIALDVPERLKVEVVSTRPHDPGAFTQGLVLDGDTLYESTGLNGKSSL